MKRGTLFFDTSMLQFGAEYRAACCQLTLMLPSKVPRILKFSTLAVVCDSNEQGHTLNIEVLDLFSRQEP